MFLICIIRKHALYLLVTVGGQSPIVILSVFAPMVRLSRTTHGAKKQEMTEQQLQAKIFQWMWNHRSETRRKFFHVANELPTDAEYVLSTVAKHLSPTPRWFAILRETIRKRIGIFLSRRRASGVVAGIPDMILIHQGRVFGFELKTQTGKTSPEQEKVHAVWKEDGAPVYVIHSLEEFQDVAERILSTKEVAV